MYNNVKKLTNEEMVALYQGEQNSRAKEDILVELMSRMEGLIKQKCISYQNIPNTTFEDRYSHLSMAFVRCLDSFDISKGYKLTTWSACYFKKAMIKLNEQMTRKKRVGGEQSSYEQMCELGHENEATAEISFTTTCEDFSQIEFMESIKGIGLTEKELITCKLIMMGVDRKDIASRLGVSQVSIFNYLKNIGKKMQGAGIAGAF